MGWKTNIFYIKSKKLKENTSFQSEDGSLINTQVSIFQEYVLLKVE